MSSSLCIYFIVSLAPAAVWLWWIRRQDVYEPEPIHLMLKACLLGMAAAVPAVLLERLLTGLTFTGGADFLYVPDATDLYESSLYCFLIVAPIEEYLKYKVIRSTIYHSDEFNEPMDGIVYMTSAAIGFSALENALYMRGFGAWVLVVRMLLSTFLHVACSGIIGLYLGISRFHPKDASRLMTRGFIIAILLHGTYDFLVKYQAGAAFLSLFVLLTGLYWARGKFFGAIHDALQESPFKPRKSFIRLRPENSQEETPS